MQHTRNMILQRAPINVVWFKRDLRLADHSPLHAACQSGLPVLLLYVVEPSQRQNPHLSLRHWRFVIESIRDMHNQLKQADCEVGVTLMYGECVETLQQLQQHHRIHTLFSQEETGDASTFERDQKVTHWCRQQGAHWQEFATGTVIRGSFNRDGWNRSLQAFASRRHWHCRFIQKFESECAMERRPVNRGYLTYPHRTDDGVNADLAAWQDGRTGYPLVDACMRCLHATG
jgi:deoxyribodipyrimidine photo-lyase